MNIIGRYHLRHHNTNLNDGKESLESRHAPLQNTEKGQVNDMKRKHIALALSVMIAATSINGSLVMAENTAEQTSQESTGETQDSAQMPGGPGNGEQPPEKSDGEMADGEMPGGQGGPGEQGGPGSGEQPPEKPDGEMPDGEMPGGQGGPGGGSAPESYEAVNEYTESAEIEGETIESTGTDENAVLVSGSDAEVKVSGSTITRNSEDSTGGDSASFYGVGSAMLATDGTLIVENSAIDTDAAGGAGVFAYGDGTVYVSDSTITTQQNTSGGIHAAGGGSLYAWNLDVTTNGDSAAAIRSDRGGGTMVIDGGSYVSNGFGSPAVYCTADISVHDATLEATGSEAVCIEGLNTLRLFDCDLTGDMLDQDQNDTTWNVIVYQSMSGDSVEGNGTFEMIGGTLTAKNGGMFYTTNTESTITLKDVEITPAENNLFFLQVTGNTNERGWGEAGNNGADCLFTAISQEMEGDVIWDSISTLDFYMTDGSSLTGAFVNDESAAGEGGNGYANLTIDETSVWTVTGDSTLSALSNAGTIVDEDGNSVTIVGTDGTVYNQGDSEFTVTVSSYQENADLSGAAATSFWEDIEAEKA